MTEKAHSKLGASSASRWFACPGSVKLCDTVPPLPDSEYAAEGTAAHKLAEHILKTSTMPKDGFDTATVEAVMVYVDAVNEDKKAINGTLEVEKPLNLSSIFRGMFGTNDALVYARWSKLIVYDYKHGAGVPVEVVNNVQLLYYALGAYIELRDLEFTEIEMVIVQPRCDHPDGPVRRWAIPITYLAEFSDRLREAALATQKPDAPLKAGSHCRWCAAKGVCPAVKQKVNEVAIADFSEPVEKALKKPEELTPEQIKTVLDNAGFLDTWIKSVEEYALSQALAGRTIPGYKLVKKKANRQWISEDEVVKSLEKKYGPKLYAAPKLLTPAQMEKMIGKKDGGATVVETLSEVPDTGLVLAAESDKRPAVETPMLTDFQ